MVLLYCIQNCHLYHRTNYGMSRSNNIGGVGCSRSRGMSISLASWQHNLSHFTFIVFLLLILVFVLDKLIKN